uniref:Remorin C-terminal domain-containing protein n=1 Tax=Kalanchoe fedtschenkoi TaxID=63787 RepID=A0A7N0ULK5_KALFE
MESLLKQARVRFADATQGGSEEGASIRGRKIPPQRTQSFKGEKNKTQNWFQRQFSGSMSKDYDTSDGGDYSAAVAAAAYAISSLYDERTPEEKQLPELEVPAAASTRIKSKSENESIRTQEPARRSKSASAPSFFQPLVPESSSAKIEGEIEDMSTKKQEPARRSKSPSESSDEKITSVRKFFGNPSDQAPRIKKKISFANDVIDPAIAKESERAITSKPSFKKRWSFGDDKSSLKRPSTFADNTPATGRPETAGPIPGGSFRKPDPRATIPLPPTPPRPRVQGSKADAWEKAQMAKIKIRYEKMRSTIDSWENKKKEKAKRRKEKIERELEQKRAKALQHFQRETETIDAVAKGARAEADNKKRKEELKVKKKADRIRTTGKLPPTCFCF